MSGFLVEVEMRSAWMALPVVVFAVGCEQEYTCDSYCVGNEDETFGTDYIVATSETEAEAECDETYSCYDEYGNDTYSLVCSCTKY